MKKLALCLAFGLTFAGTAFSNDVVVEYRIYPGRHGDASDLRARVQRLEYAVQELQLRVFNLQAENEKVKAENEKVKELEKERKKKEDRKWICRIAKFSTTYKGWGANKVEAEEAAKDECAAAENGSFYCKKPECEQATE